MSGSIRRIMEKAYKNVLSNPREAKFAFKMQQLFAKSEKRRRRVKEQDGFDVPPFLISSIATQCNLHCKGCYARSNGIALVTSSAFIDQLRGYGCKIVFFIEYVPTEPGTEYLAFSDEHVRQMEDTLEERRQEYEDIIL